MDEIEILATFDTDETAREVAKALNNWFTWSSEEDAEEESPEFFDDFGVSADDYIIDKDDIDWEEPPVARPRSNKVFVALDSSAIAETLEELLEALGAYDVSVAGDEE